MEKEKVDLLMEDSEALYHKNMAKIALLKQHRKEWIKKKLDSMIDKGVDADRLDDCIDSYFMQLERDVELAVEHERRELKKRSIAILDLLAIEHTEIDPC